MLGLALVISSTASAQCDSLILHADPVSKDGLRLNSQSFVKELLSTEDMELTMVLSEDRRYDFEVIGHREFDVFVLTGTSGSEDERKTKVRQLVLNSEQEKDGIFSITADRTQQILILFRGEKQGVSSECTGVLIYSASN